MKAYRKLWSVTKLDPVVDKIQDKLNFSGYSDDPSYIYTYCLIL